MAASAPHLVLDGFLPAEVRDALFSYALALGEIAFRRGSVRHQGDIAYNERRTGLVSEEDLGPLKEPFREAIAARVPDILRALGIAPFPVERVELELTAHGDGHYFKPHIDTLSGVNRQETDRAVTMVYYMHAQPRRFTGGELAIYPFGAGEPALIEPCNNRLVALPAFALHEVRPLACTGCSFEDYRFAVNVWLHRRKVSGPAASSA